MLSVVGVMYLQCADKVLDNINLLINFPYSMN